MIIHRDIDQGSQAWFDLRRGLPTASCADKLLTPTGRLSAQSEGYLNALLAERAGFADEPMEPTPWMLRGIELEPQARAMFELEKGLTVEQVAFVTTDDGRAGCSPDGLIDDVGFEVKCPRCSTHIGYLRAGALPPYYRPQVHFSMAVTGFERWWFMSYFPGLDPLIVLVERDEYTEKVAAALGEFCDRLNAETVRLGLND